MAHLAIDEGSVGPGELLPAVAGGVFEETDVQDHLPFDQVSMFGAELPTHKAV